jgi:hypothetical protein
LRPLLEQNITSKLKKQKREENNADWPINEKKDDSQPLRPLE